MRPCSCVARNRLWFHPHSIFECIGDTEGDAEGDVKRGRQDLFETAGLLGYRLAVLLDG